jgi:hypothetical protein
MNPNFDYEGQTACHRIDDELVFYVNLYCDEASFYVAAKSDHRARLEAIGRKLDEIGVQSAIYEGVPAFEHCATLQAVLDFTSPDFDEAIRRIFEGWKDPEAESVTELIKFFICGQGLVPEESPEPDLQIEPGGGGGF